MASADSMAALEHQLIAVGASVPSPLGWDQVGASVACLMAHRALSLYRGVLVELDGPVPVTAMVMLRPLAELTIVLKWISLDPELHAALWVGQSEDQDLRAVRRLVETGLHQGPSPAEMRAQQEKATGRDAA